MCLGSGFGCTPPFIAWMLGCVHLCARRLHTANPRWGSWCKCLGSGFGFHPSSFGWGVGVFLCLCVHSACTPPLLAGCALWMCLLGFGFCLSPRKSWIRCWVCVFVCVLRLYPADPRSGVPCGCVSLRWGFGCAPPLPAGVLVCVCLCVRSARAPSFLTRVCGVPVCAWVRVLSPPHHSWMGPWRVCVCVRAPPAPRQYWMGYVVRVSRFGFWLSPRHSWPGCAVWLCVLGFGFCLSPRQSWLGCWVVCGCVRAPPVPRQSWLGCAGWVCLLGLRFRLLPAFPGWVVGLCLFVCALCLYPTIPGCGSWCVCVSPGFGLPPAHPGWVAGACVFVCALCLYPAIPGSDVRCNCVCLVSGFGFHPASPGWPVGWCVFVCVLHLYHAIPGKGVWCRYVLGIGFRPGPNIPGWAVGVCVLVCALRLHPANAGWALWCVGQMVPDFFSRVVARCVLGALPRFAAPGGRCCLPLVSGPSLWQASCLSGVPLGPAWCAAPHLVRSLSVLWLAFPSPRCLPPALGRSPQDLLGGCAGHSEAGRERGSWCLPLAPDKVGALSSLLVAPIWGPAMGLFPARPPGVGLGLHALRWFWHVWTRSLTRRVSCTVRLRTEDSAGALQLFRADADTAPPRSENATPGSCACALVLAPPGRVWPAGLPGVFWCASPFLLAVLSFCIARPSRGWGCCFPVLLFACFLLFVFSLSLRPPADPGFLWFLALGALGLGALCFFRPPHLPGFFILVPSLSPAFSDFQPPVSRALALCAFHPPPFFIRP